MKTSDSDIISKVFQSSLSLTVSQILPITDKGITNRVYVIHTVDDQKYVVRFNESGRLDEFKKELWASDKTRTLGVTTPKIIAVGTHENNAYSIQEYIEGIHGADYDSATKVWHDLGANARIIHSISTSGFGDRIDEQGNFQSSWNDYLNYNISSITETDFLVQDGILTSDQSVAIKNLFEQLQNNTFSFGLAHGDLSLKNSLIDDKDRTWLIDWGSAHSHIIPHYDFVEILQSSIQSSSAEFVSFLTGYGYAIEDFSRISKEVYSLMLLRAVDKVRWAKERKPELLEAKINTLKKVLIIAMDIL